MQDFKPPRESPLKVYHFSVGSSNPETLKGVAPPQRGRTQVNTVLTYLETTMQAFRKKEEKDNFPTPMYQTFRAMK